MCLTILSIKQILGLLRRDRPNLDRISGSDTGSSESSAENLHRVRTPTNKRGKRTGGTSSQGLDKKKSKDKVKSGSAGEASTTKARRSSAPLEDEIRAATIASPLSSNSQVRFNF